MYKRELEINGTPLSFETGKYAKQADGSVIVRMGESVEVRLDDAWRGLLGADDERAVWRLAGAMNERLGYAR